MFPKMESRSDRDNVRMIAESIERLARRQSEALFVTLGSQGNPGTQQDLNKISASVRDLLKILDRPEEEFDRKIYPLDRMKNNFERLPKHA